MRDQPHPDHVVSDLVDLEDDLVSAFFGNWVAAVDLIDFISVVIFLGDLVALDCVVT